MNDMDEYPKEPKMSAKSFSNFPVVEVNFCIKSGDLVVSESVHGFNTTKAALRWLRKQGLSIRNATITTRQEPEDSPHPTTTLINFIRESDQPSQVPAAKPIARQPKKHPKMSRPAHKSKLAVVPASPMPSEKKHFNLAGLIEFGYQTGGDFDEALRLYTESDGAVLADFLTFPENIIEDIHLSFYNEFSK